MKDMVLSIIGTPVARMAREKPIEMDDEDWGSSICGNPHMVFFFAGWMMKIGHFYGKFIGKSRLMDVLEF